MIRTVQTLLAAMMLLAAGGCGGGDEPEEAGVEDPGPVHIHGLGVNPSDGTLLIATHTGLFRVEGDRAVRVGDNYRDMMGFTVVGPDHFLASGHPDAREDLPPFLGLLETRDAGQSWQQVSLLGEVDFHVLEASGETVVGFGSDYETGATVFLRSEDGGRGWRELDPPGEVISLALGPREGRTVLSTPEGLYESRDDGERWRELAGSPGLVAWRQDGGLISVDAGGRVHERRAGGHWATRGDAGGQPVALDAVGGELYVALHDGAVKRSSDAGREWETLVE